MAIFITSGSYAVFAILAGSGTLREATGNVTEIDDWSFANCTGKDCKWGLYNDFQVKLFLHMLYAGILIRNIHILKVFTSTQVFASFKKSEGEIGNNLYPSHDYTCLTTVLSVVALSRTITITAIVVMFPTRKS